MPGIIDAPHIRNEVLASVEPVAGKTLIWLVREITHG